MLKNYIKIAFRNIRKHKVFSIINIFGFSIALIPVLLSILYIRYELSYDHYNKNYDRIYRVVNEFNFYHKLIKSPIEPNPLASAMESDLPEVEAATRITNSTERLSFNKKKIFDLNGLYADPNVFQIFTFNFLEGSAANPLKNPYSIVLSESTAKKYFGSINPVGKILILGDVYDLTVTGVYKDIPQNSHFSADYVVSSYLISSPKIFNGASGWGLSMFYTYFLLKKGADPDNLLKKFPKFLEKYSQNVFWQNEKFYFQPLGDIHLHSHMQTELKKNGNIAIIYLYSGVALIILLIASINYINLSTTRLFQRKKEIGIRKVMGAGKQQLIRQFIVESVIITLCSFIVTILFTELLLPYFARFVDRNIEFNIFSNVSFFLFLFFVVVTIGILSGLFPAITFSSYRPASFFGGRNLLNKKNHFRNALVMIQFVFAAVFIFCSIILSQQLSFVMHKDLGYNRDNIIIIRLNNYVSHNKINDFKNQLLQYPGIISVSAISNLPNHLFDRGAIKLPGQNGNSGFVIWHDAVDYNFINLFGLKIVKGRGFSKKYPSDANDAVILNETAVNNLGWKNPIGKEIVHFTPYGSGVRHVIGVVKDFNISSLYDKVNPCYLVIDSSRHDPIIAVKIKSSILSAATLNYLKKQMNVIQPGVPFEYQYFNDIINKEYKSEFNLQKVFLMFSFFTIFISCLGLYGLISFVTELKTKEIGIRKILGASTFKIITVLLIDIVVPIIISGIIALPISYYIIHKWLSRFAYRTDINYIYLVTALVVIWVISILTMASQTFKAANQNLVDVIKYE